MSRKQKKTLARIIAAAVVFAVGLVMGIVFPESEGVTSPLFFVRAFSLMAAYLIAGFDVLLKAVWNILHGQVFDENFLMTIASIGAMVIGEYSEGAAVMIFYQVGELFQSVAVGKSRRSISDMMDINPEFANVERDGEVSEVEPDEVQVGDIVVIKPGERVPLDGVVTFGASSLNTAALTGESALREVAEGDEIISGCVNGDGLLKIRVTKLYSDSTVAKILELVENSSANKATTENFITRFARVYTPIVVIAAVLLAVIPTVVIGLTAGEWDWGDWVYRALTFLVVSCPCALVISVPLSYFGGIGGASRHGIMIKGANYLEQLAKAKTFVFDKTGTLTKGSFSVTENHPEGISEKELLSLCAAAEQISNHPIAASVVKAAKANGEIPKAENAREIAGFGVEAEVDGKKISAGNARLMNRIGLEIAEAEAAGTVVYCAVDGIYRGYILVADEIKEQSKTALAELKALGAEKTVMLTGDRKLTAEKVAETIGLDEVRSQLLPDGKVKALEKIYEAKPAKSTLAYVGDGMNDAPSLARADVGIAMGALGSDAAIEAADIVLMNDNIENLPLSVRIARKTRRIVTENIVFALGVKIAVLVLAALGIGNMWLAVFADVGVSVIAIVNAMRCMRISRKKNAHL